MGVEEIHHYTGISKEDLKNFKDKYDERIANLKDKNQYYENVTEDLTRIIKEAQKNMETYQNDIQNLEFEKTNYKYKYEQAKKNYDIIKDLYESSIKEQQKAQKKIKDMAELVKSAESQIEAFKKGWEEEKKKVN